MDRRTFLKSTLAGTLAMRAHAALPKMKIKRVRFYESPLSKPLFNQSMHIVTVETDQGLTGIGEGGSRDTVSQCGAGILRGGFTDARPGAMPSASRRPPRPRRTTSPP